MACRTISDAYNTWLSLVLLYLISCTPPFTEALWLTISGSETKCVFEELRRNALVLAEYNLIHDLVENTTSPTITAAVTSPYGKNLHSEKNVRGGQFGFTTEEPGTYLACFMVDGSRREGDRPDVSIDWKNGIDAEDWESIAKKEKIEGIEIKLRKLEGLIKTIHDNLLYFGGLEAETWEMDETTRKRVARLSMMSNGVCIMASVMQLRHLKRFFQIKKLI